MKKILLSLIFGLLFCISCTSQDEDDNSSVIIRRITDLNEDNKAFTDLVYFDNQFFLAFRESDKHAYGRDGIIKVYNSPDGSTWDLIKEFTVNGTDLRDPKFSVNENALTLYIHGSKYQDKKVTELSDYNSIFSSSGSWSEMKNVVLNNIKSNDSKILGNESWPWRVTWYNKKAYSIGYNASGIFDLYESDEGNFFKNVRSFQNIGGLPTESTLRVTDQGDFFILARRNNGNALIGRTNDPNGLWDWSAEIPIFNFGGPNFLFTENDNMLISGRENDQLILGEYDVVEKTYNRLLILKSGGDCGYAGMVRKDNFLWISYYSSHESSEGSSIYIAKINLNKLKGYKE